VTARERKRENEDGSVTRYVKLAHSVRKRGRPAERVLWDFGRKDERVRRQLEVLRESIDRVLAEPDSDTTSDRWGNMKWRPPTA
jgi:hypothetical protein